MKYFKHIRSFTLLGCALVTATNADAQGFNMLANGSFEDPSVAQGTVERLPGESTDINNWMTTAFGVDRFDPAVFGFPGTASDGALLVNLNKGYGTGGGITQLVDTTPGALYFLSFDVGTSKVPGFDGVGRVTVIAGDTSQQCTVQTNDPAVKWQRCNVSFHATDTRTRVTFVNFSVGNEQLSFLDNVVMIPSIPVGPVEIPPTP